MNNGTISRRQFLYRLGAIGGAGIALGAMDVLGLDSCTSIKVDYHAPSPTDLSPNEGAGISVLILGAGIAGLTCAYELEKGGYRCQLLEARTRPGGRNWTARHGTSETALDGSTQTCQFDEGLYMNVGPTRFPQHHTTLDYCRELKVPVHIFNNQNADAYYYVEGAGPLSNQRMRLRAVQADSLGHVSELLAKAINQGALDQELSAADKEALIEFLRSLGALTPQNRYQGSSDRGYRVRAAPGAGLQAGMIDPPFALSDLLALNTTGGPFNLGYFLAFQYQWEQAMPMFEPEGGIDAIPLALARALKGPIHYGIQVTRLENTANAVRVSYQDQWGAKQAARSRLLYLHDPAADHETHPEQLLGSGECRPVGAGPDQRGEDGPAVQAPVLGGRRANFRRHHRDQPGHPANPLPILRVPRAKGHRDRLL